jgi:hypothetical protein
MNQRLCDLQERAQALGLQIVKFYRDEELPAERSGPFVLTDYDGFHGLTPAGVSIAEIENAIARIERGRL